MEYETVARLIELLALLIMAAAFYYGYSLIKFIPKELKSLQLVVLALFFMILGRVASLFSFEIEGMVVIVSAISRHSNTCAARVQAGVSERKRAMMK